MQRKASKSCSMRTYKNWTSKELSELKRLALRFAIKDLGVVIGRPYDSVVHGLNMLGIKSPFNKPGNRRIFYAENIANIFELVDQGFSYKEIAKCFNVPPKTINQVYRRAMRLGFDCYPLLSADKSK